MNGWLTPPRRQWIKRGAYVVIVTLAYAVTTARGAVITSMLVTANPLPYIIAAIGFFEGPYMAGGLGLYGGLLISISSTTVEGAEGLILALFGVVCGSVGMMFMRRMLPSVLVCGTVLLAGRGALSAIYYRLFYSVPLLYTLSTYGMIIAASILPGCLGYWLVALVHRRLRQEE